MDEIAIRIATPDDAATLSRVGWETFLDTFVGEFAMPYPQADLDAFFAASYAPEVCARLLSDPRCRGWLAECDDEVAGFATAGPNTLPHDEARPGEGELKRLYVRSGFFGQGLAPRLMAEAMGWLEREGPRPVWLSVWSGNVRAQRFYARYGFEKAGEYGYRVGETVDHEFIFRRR